MVKAHDSISKIDKYRILLKSIVPCPSSEKVESAKLAESFEDVVADKGTPPEPILSMDPQLISTAKIPHLVLPFPRLRHHVGLGYPEGSSDHCRSIGTTKPMWSRLAILSNHEIEDRVVQ